jgi:hypothetical protein
MTNQEISTPDGAVASGGAPALAAVTLSLITFPLAFNLGAYDAVFYQDIMKVVVAAATLLVVTFFAHDRHTRIVWITRAALASLPAWFLAAVVVHGSTGEALNHNLFKIWLLVSAITSLPLTLRLMVQMFTPEVGRLRNRRLAALLAVVIVVSGVGFVVGREHPRFLTCADFSIAGSAEPDGCAK